MTNAVSEVLLRQIAMLRLVPRHPRQIGTAELRLRLAELGHVTTSRTIQRDLHTLATFFAIECQTGTKPYGWRWKRDAPLFEVPPMERESAAALLVATTVVTRHLPGLSPRLDAHLAHARSVLGIGAAEWGERFRVLVTRRPAIAAKVVDVVVRALVEERSFRCTYEARDGNAHAYDVHPLAFVVRDVGAQIVCTLGSAPVTTLAAHRIRAAELLSAPRVIPSGFDLDAFLQASRTPRAG